MWRTLNLSALIILFSLAAFGQQPRIESFEGRDVVAGEVLVRFRDTGGPQAMALAAQDTDILSSEQVGRSGAVRLRSRGRNVGTLVRAYRQRFDVLYAEPNYILRATDFPNDEFAARQWALKNTGQDIEGQIGTAGADIGVEAAWNITEGSRSIVVGVVDSGIDYNHPDLAANIWSAPAAFSVTIGGQVINCAAGTHGFNAINRTCDPMDDDGHGTHVAGIIGAAGNNGLGISGVSRLSSIMALKFLRPEGFGTTADAIAALEFAIQVKAIFPSTADIRVLNNSWGSHSLSQALMDQVSLTNANNMLFVASAGNSALNNDLIPHYPGDFKVANVVSVAALDNQDRLADFSNWGPTTVHLGAPGVGILSTVPQGPLEYNEGTSMAAPMVAGAAALVLSACPLTTAELKAALLNSVDPVLALAGRTVTGGRLDVFRALSGCIGTTAGFGLTVSPGTRRLELMQAASFDIKLTGINGFSAPVDLSLLNVPSGMTATLTSSSILGGSGSSTLTLTASNTVEAGLYLIGVRGTGGGLERVSGVAVTVGFPIAPGETISGELTLHDAPSPEEPEKYGDLFNLTLTSTTDVTIDLKSRIFDGFLYLKSNTGEILFSDNDSGAHNNSRIQASLASGTYSIEVTSRDVGDIGRYTLSINTPTLDDVFPYAAAAASSVSVSLQGNRFGSPLTIEAGSGITVTNVNVVSPTLASATLTISPDAATIPRELTVRTSEGVSNPLSFTVPPVINVSERTFGSLSDTDQILVNRAPYRYADIYRLNLPASTTVDIDLIANDFDAHLYLLSSAGDVLFQDDDGGFLLNARISTTLPAGTYFIEATSSNRLERGDYAVSVNVPTLESIIMPFSMAFLPVGGSGVVTLTGTRLSGVSFINAGSGVTVSNINVSNSTRISARFTVSAVATPGDRSVRVTTPEGTTNSLTYRVTPVIPLISPGASVSGVLSPSDPQSMVLPGSHADLYRISTPVPGLVAIDLVTTGFEGHLTLFSSSGDVLAGSEDPENTGSIKIVGNFPGATYIEVTSREPGATGSYSLKFNTILITSITPTFGSQGTTVELLYSGRFSAGPATIDAGPGISATFQSFSVSPAGVTSGSVRFVISAGAPLGPRQIKFTSPGGSDFITFDVLPPLPSLTVGQEVSGTLSGADQPSLTDRTTYGDFYRLSVTGTAVVELSSTEFEVSLTELSLNGTVINQSTGPIARLVNLTAGDHILQVTSRSPAVGVYKLSVPSPPTLTAITPNVGIRGTTLGVVLTGTNFSSPMSIISVPNHVTFTNVNVYSPTLASAVATILPLQIFPCCTLDPVGVKNVSVLTNSGTSSATQFTVVASGSEPVPASRLSFARFFAPADLAGTGIAVVNPAAVAAEVRFWMYNTAGLPVGFYTETVGPRSQMARLGSELFPGAIAAGRIEVTSTTTGLQGFWFGGDFTNVMDGTESAPKARDLIFPLVTPNTDLTLTGSIATSASVRVYDGFGAEVGPALDLIIPANGGVQRSLGLLFPSVDLNSAKYVRATAGEPIMGTTVIKDMPVSPAWVVLNGIDSSVLSTEANFPHVPSGGGWVSVAGITNLSTGPQAVTFTYYPNSGSPVSVIRNLTGRGSIRESADDMFGFAGSTQDGWVKVTGTLPLTGYVVYGYGPTGGSAAVPVQTTPQTSMIFSHVATGPAFNTGLALLNTTTRDANVEVYIMRRTGALVGGAGDVLTAAFTVKAGTKIARLLDEFVPASVNDDGFVFVRSTNDVPLYAFELFFTRDAKVIANVPAGILGPGISYAPPLPLNPLSPLTISSLNPPAAPAGTVITIHGVGFDPTATNNTIVFTTATAAVSVPAMAVTPSSLTVAIPSNAVGGPVFFTTGGRFSNSVTLTVP